ncbi:hypothetical protein ADU59_19755 [Pararhizobium polonicum]|uniref:Uncharacterized protein n=1 Tax=Pararhizobium polonicum TaxID=1612624 RepID=A0A1C7NYW5_9HYPH|nr:hypothetical protein [Pararhizobium polonicum]OBZ93926.1 hypothetical protein ADU59_19755 [Pararhizobium polonicum]
MLRLSQVALLFATLALLPVSASAQSDEDVYNRIESLHGNAGDLNEPLLSLVEAMGNDDAATIAGLAEYPLRVAANGESYEIQNADDFIENFDTLVTQDTRDAVAGQTYGQLFVNSDGVMLADGAVWMSNVCDNGDCSSSHWAVISINN